MNKEWLLDTLYRCVATFGEALLGVGVYNATITSVDWKYVLGVSATTTLACFIKCVVTGAKQNINPKYDEPADYDIHN